MTVNYNLDVSSASIFSFLRLQLRWKGSIWKYLLKVCLISKLTIIERILIRLKKVVNEFISIYSIYLFISISIYFYYMNLFI